MARAFLLLIALALTPRPSAAACAIDDPALAAAWQTLRVVDCARCHGKDYDGLAAPSIVEYVRHQSREGFDRIILDGDPPRGMPGYRDNRRIAGMMDALYRYFAARATGTVGPSDRPAGMHRTDGAPPC